MAPLATENLEMVEKLSLLPGDKTVTDVFGDFLRYLYNCTKMYVQDTHLPNGDALWESVANDIQYVISHPNGWEGTQQVQMRIAAVAADLIPNTNKGHARVRFITEGEASLHFCLMHGLSTETMEVNILSSLSDAESHSKISRKEEVLLWLMLAGEQLT